MMSKLEASAPYFCDSSLECLTFRIIRRDMIKTRHGGACRWLSGIRLTCSLRLLMSGSPLAPVSRAELPLQIDARTLPSQSSRDYVLLAANVSTTPGTTKNQLCLRRTQSTPKRNPDPSAYLLSLGKSIRTKVERRAASKIVIQSNCPETQ
jgi:hypothetical protein